MGAAAALRIATTHRPLRSFAPNEFVDELRRALDERRLHDDLVEPGRMSALESRLVGVIRVPEDRDVRPGIDDFLRLDPRDVCDHEVRRVDAVARDQPMARKQPLQFSAEEEVDPDEQDRRHGFDSINRCGRG